MKTRSALLICITLAFWPISGLALALGDPKDGIDAEGYISTWLVLAPIRLEEGQEGSDALDKEPVKNEAKLEPKVGEKLNIAGKELNWKSATTKEQVLNFNDILGVVTENSMGYAVVYLISDKDQTDLSLRIGSDDQIKVFLNGKTIHSHPEARPLEKDEDTVSGLSLKKGTNVLILKVVNEGEDWAASARLVDKDGKHVDGVKAAIKPE
jgi:hypothetical protein